MRRSGSMTTMNRSGRCRGNHRCIRHAGAVRGRCSRGCSLIGFACRCGSRGCSSSHGCGLGCGCGSSRDCSSGCGCGSSHGCGLGCDCGSNRGCGSGHGCSLGCDCGLVCGCGLRGSDTPATCNLRPECGLPTLSLWVDLVTTPGRIRIVVWTSEATPAIALVNAVENDVANSVKLVTTSETCDTRPLTD